jgi:hypothetical protein
MQRLGDSARILAVQDFCLEECGVQVHHLLDIAEVTCFPQPIEQGYDLSMLATFGYEVEHPYLVFYRTQSPAFTTLDRAKGELPWFLALWWLGGIACLLQAW